MQFSACRKSLKAFVLYMQSFYTEKTAIRKKPPNNFYSAASVYVKILQLFKYFYISSR